MRRRALGTIVVLALLGAAAAAPSVFASGDAPKAPRSAAASSARMTFGTPTVVDPVHTYGEPDIKIAPDGTVYDSGPWGTGTQRSLWEQSTDGGHTFHVLHDTAVQSPEQSDSTIAGPGGGDTEIAIDHTNKVYYADLAALEELKVATWDRATRTMKTGVLQTPQSATNGVDRQWFAVWDPPNPTAVRAATGYTGPFPVNYLVYLAATGGSSCNPPAVSSCEILQYSTDGVNYQPPTGSEQLSNDGPTVIDQQTGTVFQAIGTTDSSHVGIGMYTRDPAGAKTDPSLKKTKTIQVATLPGGGGVNALFPVPAFDQARNLYLVWVTRNDSKSQKQDATQWQIYYSYATAATGWTQWSTPVQVSKPPSNTNIMPWAVAGSDGRLAIVWYGTNDRTHNPSTQDAHQVWDVYLANITNAATPTPTMQQIKVTRHPIHYGSICLQGTGCAAQNPPGNRNLADFFENSIDPRTGALVITYNDLSNELKQHDPSGSGTPPEQAAHRGAPVVMMVRQTGGTSMFGTPLHGRSPFASSITDKKGDASFDPIYSSKNIKPLDLRRLSARRRGKNVVFTLQASTLASLAPAFTATNATAIDYVIRWTGATAKNPDTKLSYNPLYYAAVEVTQGGSPTFFTGQARSVELCSVSGCDPHVLEYPAPPYGGTSVKGKLVKTKGPKPDSWVITVPLKLIGSPKLRSVLQDMGAYVFARSKPASTPITNAEAQGAITPIVVDGVCCVELRLRK